jgi:hypothetical protein
MEDRVVIHLKKLMEFMLYDGDLQGASTIHDAIDIINQQNDELGKLRAYIHDNGLEWDLLSYYKRNGG